MIELKTLPVTAAAAANHDQVEQKQTVNNTEKTTKCDKPTGSNKGGEALLA